VLLDEMLDRRLKQWLPEGVEVVTVQELGWDSRTNRELLTSAEKEFDVLLTTDQGIPHQREHTRDRRERRPSHRLPSR
jgi:predicted nuclease of predicted toxin-antitoxin system